MGAWLRSKGRENSRNYRGINFESCKGITRGFCEKTIRTTTTYLRKQEKSGYDLANEENVLGLSYWKSLNQVGVIMKLLSLMKSALKFLLNRA